MPEKLRMSERSRQTNCQIEPSYPSMHTVVWSFRYPDMTAHDPTLWCPIEGPHLIVECDEWKDPDCA